MSIGLTKKGDMTDYEWFLLLAENGHSSYQYRLAIEINSKSKNSDRLVQSYKWLVLSILLGENRSKEILDFIYLGMSSEEINLADSLIDSWIEDKFESKPNQDRSGWSSELKKFTSGASSKDHKDLS